MDEEADDTEKVQFLHSNIMDHILELIGSYLRQKADLDTLLLTTEKRIKEMEQRFEIMQGMAKAFQEDLFRHGLEKFTDSRLVNKVGELL